MKIKGKSQNWFVLMEWGKKRKWNISGCEIGDVDEYKYLGVTVKAVLNGRLKVCGTE